MLIPRMPTTEDSRHPACTALLGDLQHAGATGICDRFGAKSVSLRAMPHGTPHCPMPVLPHPTTFPGDPRDPVQTPQKPATGAFAPGAMAGAGKPGVTRTINSCRAHIRDIMDWWTTKFAKLTRTSMPASKACQLSHCPTQSVLEPMVTTFAYPSGEMP